MKLPSGLGERGSSPPGGMVDVGVSITASMLADNGPSGQAIGLGGAMERNLPEEGLSSLGLGSSSGLSREAVMVPLAPMSSTRPNFVEREKRKDPLRLTEVQSTNAMSAVVRSLMVVFFFLQFIRLKI